MRIGGGEQVEELKEGYLDKLKEERRARLADKKNLEQRAEQENTTQVQPPVSDAPAPEPPKKRWFSWRRQNPNKGKKAG